MFLFARVNGGFHYSLYYSYFKVDCFIKSKKKRYTHLIIFMITDQKGGDVRLLQEHYKPTPIKRVLKSNALKKSLNHYTLLYKQSEYFTSLIFLFWLHWCPYAELNSIQNSYSVSCFISWYHYSHNKMRYLAYSAGKLNIVFFCFIYPSKSKR